MFEIKENVRFVPKNQIPREYYQTVKNPAQPNPDEEVVFLYALLNLDMTKELDSSILNCQNKLFESPKERYDAQFSVLHDLIVNPKRQ